jgi:hypothetical protein
MPVAINFVGYGQFHLAVWIAAGAVWRDQILARRVADERHDPRSLGIIGAGVVWIVTSTISTASDLCIAIGMVTIAGSARVGLTHEDQQSVDNTARGDGNAEGRHR